MSSESTAPSPSISDASKNVTGVGILKSHACVLCQQRKVRCDRLPAGCSNCTKARVDCIYRAPLPPRRRKRKLQEPDLLVRLKQCEDLLKSLGVNLDTSVTPRHQSSKQSSAREDVENIKEDLKTVRLDDGPPVPTEPTTSEEEMVPGLEYGRLISSGTNTRYLGNFLWTHVSDEVQDASDILHESSDDEDADTRVYDTPPEICHDPTNLIFHDRRPAVDLEGLHPPPHQMFKLWQLFLDRVNPLSRVIHAPSVQQLVLEASGNLKIISRSAEALLFAIYSTAVMSINPTECQQLFDGDKRTLLGRYQFAAQQALINAGLLRTSDLQVLQTFVIYLLSIASSYDARAFWALTGLSIRIGQRIGLHRDGAALGLPVFEVEMRRRLWWQMILLDGRAGEVSGSGMAHLVWDVQRPLNLNDSDLSPDMKEMPVEHKGPTEMIFALMRYEIGNFLKQGTPVSAFDGAWNKLTTQNIPVEEKLKSIDELNKVLEEKFLQYCDSNIPLHFLCLALSRSAMCKMKVAACMGRLRQQQESKDTTSQSLLQQRDEVFHYCTTMMASHELMLSDPRLQRFHWHPASHVQWQPIIFLLHELKERTSGEAVDSAWTKIQNIYTFKPELVRQKKALHVAVGNLALKAWKAYEGKARQDGRALAVPQFISQLRAQRDTNSSSDGSTVSSTAPVLTGNVLNSYPCQTLPSISTPLAVTAAGYHTLDIPPLPTTINPSSVLTGTSQAAAEPTHVDSMLPFTNLEDGPMDWERWNDLLENFQMEAMDGFMNDGYDYS